jgi:hypothetical protein
MGENALVAKWPKLVGRRTRIVIMPSSDGNGAFASAVLGERVSFYNRCEAVMAS